MGVTLPSPKTGSPVIILTDTHSLGITTFFCAHRNGGDQTGKTGGIQNISKEDYKLIYESSVNLSFSTMAEVYAHHDFNSHHGMGAGDSFGSNLTPNRSNVKPVFESTTNGSSWEFPAQWRGGGFYIALAYGVCYTVVLSDHERNAAICLFSSTQKQEWFFIATSLQDLRFQKWLSPDQ